MKSNEIKTALDELIKSAGATPTKPQKEQIEALKADYELALAQEDASETATDGPVLPKKVKNRVVYTENTKISEDWDGNPLERPYALVSFSDPIKGKTVTYPVNLDYFERVLEPVLTEDAFYEIEVEKQLADKTYYVRKKDGAEIVHEEDRDSLNAIKRLPSYMLENMLADVKREAEKANDIKIITQAAPEVANALAAYLAQK